MKKNGKDPLGAKSTEEISKTKLDEILVGEDVEAAALIHSAIEEFAQELAYVTGRFLKTKAWDKTEAIIVGGGFRQSRIGELAIARADIILKADGAKVSLIPIRFHPDEAALIGCAHLAPSWIFEGHDSLLAVDIGGTNIRCGVVETRQKKVPDLSKASVWKSELWRHADDEPTREGAVKKLAGLLKGLLKEAEDKGLKLAPFIGVSCPGAIDADGSIEKGAQNLPGNWESSKFNLPASLIELIPSIRDHDTAVLMHNDGVVQGLSEIPFMQDYKRWESSPSVPGSAMRASPCAVRKRRRRGEASGYAVAVYASSWCKVAWISGFCGSSSLVRSVHSKWHEMAAGALSGPASSHRTRPRPGGKPPFWYLERWQSGRMHRTRNAA